MPMCAIGLSKTLCGWGSVKRSPVSILKFAASVFCALPMSAHAQISLERFQEYVDKVCKDAPLESRNSKAELNANAKIELNDLLKKLAGAGASISGSKAQEESFGIKQDQLAASIKDGNDCRVAMYREFKDKIDFGGTSSDRRLEKIPR